MPSKLPTIAVRLRPHIFEVYARLAALQGRSRGAVVAELLEAVHEPMMRTVALLEAAREAPVQVRRGLKRTLEDMERDLIGSAGAGLAQMDLLIERLAVPAGRQRERSEPAGRPASIAQESGNRGGSTPGPVTRGSGSDFVQYSGGRKRSSKTPRGGQ